MNSKTVKMANSQTQNVKSLNVQIDIITSDTFANVLVCLKSPENGQELYHETFKMLPNVPLETYVQYTFGMYNASICKNEDENA